MELLRMEHITKSFFKTPVLDDVNLIIEEGEVHALLGENGAGKSTLMNILGGVYTKDKGKVWFTGKELLHNSVREAEENGIGFVHQELNLFNDLKVYENLFLGKELLNAFGKLKKKAMIQETKELFKNLGVDIDPTEMADHLDAGKKQLLEIAKTLHRDAKLFILDEPTTALSNEEIKKLFEIISRLKKNGKSFIFISHKMPEIFMIADKYTVLRNGKFISTGFIKDTTPEEIAGHMVGENYSNHELYEKRKLGDTVLELKELSGTGFQDISLSVRKGEIIGFTGLQGAGCSQVLQTIFGVHKSDSGQILIQGRSVRNHSVKAAMRNKIAMVASNRKENSILPDMSILENMYISEHILHNRNQHIYKKRELNNYVRMKDVLNIKATAGPHKLITSLSGGNQQKIILARWLNTQAEILLFDNPTQGIDVGAKSEIYKLILELSKQGKTIIVNTLEIPEIQKIADRCIVFYHGKIAGILERNEICEERVMLYATSALNIDNNCTEV